MFTTFCIVVGLSFAAFIGAVTQPKTNL